MGVDYYSPISCQEDAINIYVRTSINAGPIQKSLRLFYDNVEYGDQHLLHEAKMLSQVENALDGTKYPLVIKDSHGHTFTQDVAVHEHMLKNSN